MLSKSGYSVFVANNGADGIAMAKVKLPDLIIMDIMLPDIQGGEAVRTIKKYPPCSDIFVIFLTGLMSSNEGIDHDIDTINVDGKVYPVLGKPFDFSKLLNNIKRILN